MSAFKFPDLPVTAVRPGVERRVAYGDQLMLVIFDFSDGPQTQPDPPHQHPHEQVSYVVEGEILFFLGGEPPVRLGPGDGYTVPSNVPHCIQLLTPRVRLMDSFTPLREDFLGK
ncbi:MAG TPA: cupin domain-containing protein [Anaerolineales bacterium]|nr:cupin domain-containing protein [Anaerolineales bacterium]